MTQEIPKKPRIVSKAEFDQGWDSERSFHQLKDLEVNVRGTRLYIPVKTKTDMEEEYGGPVTHIKSRTFPDFRVWITPCNPKDPDARPLRPTTDAQSSAEVGFSIPLRKLEVKVPKSRKFTFPLERLEVEGGGVVYEMSFKNYANEKRRPNPQQGEQPSGDAPPNKEQ